LLLALPARADRGPAWQRDPVLSQVLVQQMATDNLGYRWVATDEGVFRYDGYELVPLRKLLRPGSVPPPAQHVRSLLKDRRGRLWLGAETALYCLDPLQSRLRRVPFPALAEGGAGFLLFQHPRTGYLWAMDGSGTLLIIDPSQPRQPRYAARHLAVAAPLLLQAAATGAGAWLSGTGGEVQQLAPDGRPLLRLRCPEAAVPLPATAPLRLLGATASYQADAATHQVRETVRWLPRQPGTPERPCLTDSTLEWTTPRHLVRLGRWHQPRPTVQVGPLHLGEGSAPAIAYALEYDELGTRWLYSRIWRGCYKQRPVPRVVQALRTADPGQPPLASSRAIVRLPDGRLLVSTYDSTWAQPAGQPRAPLQRFCRRATGLQLSNIFNAALVLPDSTVLVAAAFLGFHRLDPATGELHPLPVVAGPRPSRYVSLFRDHAGRVWGGGEPGLFRLDARRQRSVRYANATPGFPLHRLFINDIAEDQASGCLWLATSGGLYLLDPATGRLRHYGETQATGRALPTNDLLTVAAAGPGRAWVGTRTEGLLLVAATAGWQQQVSTAEGLPSPTVATLLLRHDTVWAGTFAGLVRYAPGSQSLTILAAPDGLTDAELNRQSAYADPATGTLWFGGVGGVYGVRPAALRPPARRVRPRLLATAVVGPAPGGNGPGELRLLPAGELPVLLLGAKPTAFIELHLAVTDFLFPEAVRYAYRLRQDDGAVLSPWLATPRRLLLRSLAAGTYVLEVRAEIGGRFAANVLRVPLTVRRVWWQHPLVLGLAAALLPGLGYLIYGLRLRRARREAHLRESLRNDLAANLHDEVGALLTRINFQAQVLRDQHLYPSAHDPDSGPGFERLLANSAAAVQTMRDVVWSIDTQADSVGALLDRMRDQLDQLSAVTGIGMALHTANLPDALPLPPAVRQQLYLIFKEALTNAVRHATGATNISISLVRTPAGALALEVVDDGTGAQAAGRTPTGLGLRNMAQRARTMGAELQTGPRPDGRPGYRVWVLVRP
jgi:signal transduction histidine kinase/streptogramin lyase